MEFGKIIQVESEIYIGSVKDLLVMLGEFAAEECTSVFTENKGHEILEDFHLVVAENTLQKAQELMCWCIHRGYNSNTIVLIDMVDEESTEINIYIVKEG